MKKIFKSMIIFTMIFGLINVNLKELSAYNDFSKSQSATYRLSNGSEVRVEYHNGKPHIHEKTRGGKWNKSENINDGSAHHKGESKLTRSTRDIVKNGKGKSAHDKAANKKAKQLEKSYKDYEAAKKRSKSKSKDFVKKNKQEIKKASNAGAGLVVIGGVLYGVWWLFKLSSGWGMLIPV